MLGYLRARTDTGMPTDRNRTARQRRMMVAISNKLKTEGKLSMIPELISAASSGIWTNASFAQTAALANYALKISPDSIGMHVMDGYVNITYDWAFCFVHQLERIALLQSVYGIEAQELPYCTRQYEKWLHEHGFAMYKSLAVAETLLEALHEQIGAVPLTAEKSTAYHAFWHAYQDVLVKKEAAEAALDAVESTAIERAIADMRTAAEAAAVAFVYEEPLRWDYDDGNWWADPCINEVLVDFR